MTLFLDTIYFACCNFFKRREPHMFKASGLILIATVFMCNSLLILFLIQENSLGFNNKGLYEMRYYTVSSFIILFTCLFYIRYYRLTNYEIVYNRIHSLGIIRKNTLYFFAIIYIIASFISCIGYAIWVGSN